MTAPALPPPDLLLIRLSEELALCSELLFGIESEVAAMIQSTSAQMRPAPDALQKIDLLAQTLGDLSACLAGLGKVPFPAPAAADWAESALAALRLEDLRRRLAGQAARQDPRRDGVDFF